MPIHRFKLNPYSGFVENHLFPGVVQQGLFHLLTGHVILLDADTKGLAFQLRAGHVLALNDELLKQEMTGALGTLLQYDLVIRDQVDPLERYFDHYLVRPRQNPAVAYHTIEGETVVVRTSMLNRLYAPARDELPQIVEEVLPRDAAQMFQKADGATSLREVLDILGDSDAREALKFLTMPERQLVKLAPIREHLEEPFQPFNLVPRTFRVSTSSSLQSPEKSSVSDFHEHGIEDAQWEFDWIEPTVNHAFRFPSPAFGGLSYGARLCEVTFSQVLDTETKRCRILEIGGGTGSFARAFLDQAKARFPSREIEYHLMDLSPTLFQQQELALGTYLSPEHHYLQDATELTLPEQEFDLILGNEVIADFPVALVEQHLVEGKTVWRGAGASYVEEFELAEPNSPNRFLVSSGLFEFVKRAWNHVPPGGTVLLTEYGGLNQYPARAYHLNHDEYSIHFGHLQKCASRIGFECRVVPLTEFLKIDERAEFLDGQEEKILCLNHILRRFGESLPYAAISKSEFELRLKPIADRINLAGVTFSPLSAQFHYGPTLPQFFVAVLKKPNVA